MGKERKAPPFVMLRRDLLKDPEWRALSSSAKIVYIYMRAKFNYKTFSEVSLTYSEMKDVLGAEAMSKALKDLVSGGWIVPKTKGGLMSGFSTYKFNGKYKEFYYKGTPI